MTATGVVADDIERLSLVMRTDRWSGAGDTVVRVRAIPEGIIGEELVVDPVGAAQIVTVVSVQDRDITITPALGATLEPDTAVIRKQFAEFITSGAQMSLAADASATDLTVTVKSKLTGLQPRSGWVVIDPYTIEAEVREVTAISSNDFTIAALTYNHSENDPVLWLPEPEFNARQFGAKGDDSTADYTALQSAITASSGVGPVVIPDGDYRIATALSIPSNVRIRGGPNAVLKPSAAGMRPFVNADTVGGNTDIAIEGITIDGNLQSADTTALPGALINVTRPSVRNCKFINMPRSALSVEDSSDIVVVGNQFNAIGTAQHSPGGVNVGTAINIDDPDRGVVQGNVIYDIWQVAIFVSGSAAHGDLTIDGNVCVDMEDNGIRVNTLSLSRRCVVSNNVVVDATIDCIRANGFNNVVTGNVCAGSAKTPQTGIKTDHGVDYSITGNLIDTCDTGIYWRADESSSHVLIEGNWLDNCGSAIVITRVTGNEVLNDFSVIGNHIKATTLGTADAIAIGGAATGVLIANNTVVDSARDGISLGAITDAVITGNKVKSAADDGIIVSAASSLVVITSNNVTSCTGHGIRVDSSDDITIQGNISVLNGGHGIRLATCNDVTVGGNVCKENNVNDSGFDGIGVSTCTNVLVYGNRCLDDRGTKLQEYGIQYDNNTTLRIFGNDLADNELGETNDAGGNTGVSIFKFTTQTTIADPAGGGTQDAEARTAINAIIDALQAIGAVA